jgi:hypothetical protein
MIEVVSYHGLSEVLSSRKVTRRAQGEVERGWQDKSADGCRGACGWWDSDFRHFESSAGWLILRKGQGHQ